MTRAVRAMADGNSETIRTKLNERLFSWLLACFASLAMTGRVRRRPLPVIARRSCAAAIQSFLRPPRSVQAPRGRLAQPGSAMEDDHRGICEGTGMGAGFGRAIFISGLL